MPHFTQKYGPSGPLLHKNGIPISMNKSLCEPGIPIFIRFKPLPQSLLKCCKKTNTFSLHLQVKSCLQGCRKQEKSEGAYQIANTLGSSAFWSVTNSKSPRKSSLSEILVYSAIDNREERLEMHIHIYGDVMADASHSMPPSQLSTAKSGTSICGFIEPSV